MPVLVPKSLRISNESGRDGTTKETSVYGYDLLYGTSYASYVAPTGAWNFVWFQAADGSIKQARWYGEWSITTILAPGIAVLHTPLSAILWGPQDTIRLYYLNPQFELQEWCWDTKNGSDNKYGGALNGAGVRVAPYSKLGAIAFGDFNLRVYYQGTNNKIEEYAYGGGQGWRKGATLPGDALPGTYLSFVNRNAWDASPPSIRGYFQTVTGSLAEQVWESGGGWTIGNFSIPSAPFLTPIAATSSAEKDFPKIHVYWLSVDSTIIESVNWRGWRAPKEIDNINIVNGHISATSFTRGDKNVDVRIYGTAQLNVLFERISRYSVWEKIHSISVGREVTLEVLGA
ncbi:uncharacterized protein DFL_007541 [Arthrobotrys flagrans]|uniref:Uncharacterized protein n=1 Tax=Arthrobotrys flagrans TaxID=97331 RepID=A0A436ZWE1_ARTFL|nr:hypothetical protein DFL_007541 [Arthrobotrys flagrans]